MPDTLVVTAVYGKTYLKYLPSLLASLWEQGEQEIIIVTDGARYPEIDNLLTWATYQKDLTINVTAVGEDPVFQQAMSGSTPTMSKLVAWRRGLRLGGVGRKFVCLDVDSMVMAPLSQLFGEASTRPFNLAVPRSLHASGRYIYKPSLLAGIATSVVDRELESWTREAIMLDRVERRTIVDLYGSVLSGAFTKVAAMALEGGSTIMAYLPGKTWCAEAPPFEGSGVVHFRGSNVPPREDDETWASLTTQWHAARERYFQRVGKEVSEPQTLMEKGEVS